MEKKFLSSRGAFCLLFVMTLGTSLILGIPFNAKQDSWVSMLAALVMALPLILVLARLMRLYPEKNIFEMLYAAFGRIGGAIFTVILSIYALNLAAATIQIFSNFFNVIALDRTPLIIIMICMAAAALYLVRSGISVMGKWAMAVLVIFAALILFAFATAAVEFKPENLLPAFENGVDSIFAGAVSILAFPLGETVLFLALAGSVKKTSNPYKILIFNLITSVLVLLCIFLKNLLVLGRYTMDTVFFPSYATARVARISVIFERIESLISYFYLFAGITRTAICVYAAAAGAGRLFCISKTKNLTVPVMLLSLAVSSLLFDCMLDIFKIKEMYPYLALPIQLGIPALLWITAEIKHARAKKKQNQITTAL